MKILSLIILNIYFLCINSESLLYDDEIHITNIKQLTFSGHHSLPTFSYDGNYIAFAARGGDYGIDCDQVFRLNLNDLTDKPSRISPGYGYATNPRFSPNSNDITFETNFHRFTGFQKDFIATQSCPVSTCQSTTDSNIQALCSKQTWPLYPDTDVFLFNKYGNVKEQLTFSNKSGYNGEGWVAGKSFDGDKIYFTSKDKEGINYYERQLNSKLPTSLTNSKTTAYYGGMYIDSSERRVTFHGNRPDNPSSGEMLKQYLDNNIVPVDRLQIYHASFDGFEIQQVKNLSQFTSFYPSFANKGGTKIIFSTNYQQKSSKNYGLFLYNVLDETLTQISTVTANISTIQADVSYDYKKIVFTSNRNSKNPDEFQLFIADFNVTGTSPYPFDGDASEVHLEQVPKSESTSEEAAQCWQNTETNNLYDGILHFPGEVHLKNVKQLTFGGENAEGYFSFDDNKLTFQATGPDNYGTACDQIYQIDLCKDPKKQTPHKMSTGIGVTTCSYFFSNNKQSLYAGTFKSVKVESNTPKDATCPTKLCNPANPILQTNQTIADLCKNASYVWDIYPEFDIFLVNEYGIITKQLTDTPGYDAEGVISPDGTMIAFTSTRNGDLDLYIMNIDGSNVRQITNVTGYDGGAFFSPDNKRLIFRASRPKEGPEADYYRLLLKYNIVVPLKMELFVVDIDGNNMKQITTLGGASWAPYYLPDNKRVIFSSDYNNKQGFGAFDLYVINDDGTGLERITKDDGKFDAFPMFSHATNKLVWGSSRNGSEYDLNLFIADWVDEPQNPLTTPNPSQNPASVSTDSLTSTQNPMDSTTSSGIINNPIVSLICVIFVVKFIF